MIYLLNFYSICPFSFYDDPHGLKQDNDVQPQIPVPHIPGIQGNSVIIALMISPGNLPKPGDAGGNSETQSSHFAVIFVNFYLS